MGGIAFGQLAGWLLDHGFGYAPVLAIAGSLHLAALLVILVTVPTMQPLTFEARPAGASP
jgi:ACS family hexuronate transporter-like MFS transporter